MGNFRQLSQLFDPGINEVWRLPSDYDDDFVTWYIHKRRRPNTSEHLIHFCGCFLLKKLPKYVYRALDRLDLTEKDLKVYTIHGKTYVTASRSVGYKPKPINQLFKSTSKLEK